ncbi:MAG: FAD-dependent oxidoreductase, partial [Smithella sp.]|nr:FAD-dependent oxidoreductase [Smithella sp.]
MVDPDVVGAPFTVIVDEDKCLGCGVCMRNCPGDGIDMVPKSQYSNVQAPACQFNCPAGIDIREYVKLLNDGASLAEAWKVLTRNNPFPRSYRQSMSPDDLRKQFKAVYMAIGAQGSTALGVDSEEGKVLSGLAFLKAVREKNPTKIGKKVVVIGGGNTAIDAARTARRMGSEVTILYRRTAAEMPAYEEEVKAAKDEGVKIQFLCAPVKLGGSSNAVTVTCTKIELGSPDASGRPKPVPVKGSEFDVQCETLIAAIGQDINLTGLENIPRANNWIGADVLGQTTEKGIFAGGDAVTGPALVASAIGAGCKAALSIDAFIKGKKAELPEKMEVSYKDLPLRNASHFKHLQDIKRTEVEKLEASKR